MEQSEAVKYRSIGEQLMEMDQKAISLSNEELLEGKDRDIQQDALEMAEEYLNQNEATPELNRAIFMLYHHGAGVDKELTVRTYKEIENGNKKPSVEFAKAYLQNEMIAKKHLDAYVEASDENEYSVIQDKANWHRRVAYYAGFSGDSEMQKENFETAIKLHERLKETNPDVQSIIDEIKKENNDNKF